MNEYQGKTAAVIGLARAGVPAARFLAERGAKVLGFDGKTREQLSAEALELESVGIELVLGDHNFAGIEVCDLVVLSPGLKVHYEPLLSVIAAAEARGAEVIGELELAYRHCPCPIIGVTGTKGKSTTTKLIAEMLQASGVDAVAAGNTGTPLISVLPTLNESSWAVVEVSSFQLEKAPTFRPKIAILLSLLEDHQDYHPDLEQYWNTKLRIFFNQKCDGANSDWSLFNIDDPRVLERSADIYNYGMPGAFSGKNESDENAERYELISFWQNDRLMDLIDESEVPLKGAHNRANLSGALGAVSLALGHEKFAANRSQIADAIRQFQTLPHRLEIVAHKDGITWVNDSQSTIPDATIAALRSFPSPVTLLVGGRAKIEGAAYEGMMRAIHAEKARLILFGESAEMLREVALGQGLEIFNIFIEKTLAEALQIAKINASDSESVILSPACASFDQFTSYEHRGETFRQLVREI
ncbi:UDP-N-acetylmuramoyl-L-alanine--D-glutamate ligase [bacterium]|nr:MAG: UDP-N-acetylmuramoyl-L-alanine--D-glutamate ligase [bacterium]